ncbi:MAG: hypothetical protein AAB479_01145 [Patescibacteria group bacterium]
MTNPLLPRSLTPEDIEAFKKAYEKDWSEKLSEAEARVMAEKIAELFRGLAKLEVPPPASEPPKAPSESKELKQPSLF